MTFQLCLLSDQPDYCLPLARQLLLERHREGLSGDLAQVTQRLLAQSRQVLVALRGASVVGCAGLCRFPFGPPGHCWLTNVWVSAACRGAGLGRHLCRVQQARARAQGVDQLFLYTRDRRRFYQAMGWALAGRAVLAGNPCDIMSLRLRREPSPP